MDRHDVGGTPILLYLTDELGQEWMVAALAGPVVGPNGEVIQVDELKDQNFKLQRIKAVQEAPHASQ